MADHYVTIGTKVDPKNRVNLIAVDKQWVNVVKGDVVIYKNVLDGGANATVTFYATSDKAAPISGFCQGSAGTGLTVTNGGEAKCGITQGDPKKPLQIAYMVSTDATDARKHVDLDPVIIIQPKVLITLPDLGFVAGRPAIILLGIGLVVALALGYRFGRTAATG